jgi:GH15 family glucan-1,4-alpha-glucosidase
MASKIEDYGLIGNTHTSALVSRSGSMDWLCAPRFDSDACFAAIVGYDEHGRWALRPTVTIRENRQRYREDTMILETEFACDGGVVRIIDFMPVNDRCDIVRIIEGLDGEVPIEMLLDVRFGYGANAPFIEKRGDGLCLLSGPDAFLLRTPAALEQTGKRVSAFFNVKKGDRIPLQLTWFASHSAPPAAIDVEQALASTEQFWRDWPGAAPTRDAGATPSYVH